MKITHYTTVHNRRDNRVFFKMCVGLASAGHDVTLIVADGKGDELYLGVKVIDIAEMGRIRNQVKRILTFYPILHGMIASSSADLHHFHDPELFPLASFVNGKKGIKVVCDVHENVAEQIRDKARIPVFLRRFISALFRTYTRLSLIKLPLVIAEGSYVVEFKGATQLETVLNFPKLDKLLTLESIKANIGEVSLGYIGGITRDRGALTMVELTSELRLRFGYRVRLQLVGPVAGELKEEMTQAYEARGGNANDLVFHGYLENMDGLKIMKGCDIGVALLKPIKNYVESYPTKVFEYLALGLPVITSDFPLYRDVLIDGKFGLLSAPNKPTTAANKIDALLKDDARREFLQVEGKAYVAKSFDWKLEQVKLVDFYRSILSR